jgi:hypothetical protein
MLGVCVTFFVALLLCPILLCVAFEWQRRRKAQQLNRVVSELPVQFVLLEALVRFVVQPLLRRTLHTPTADEVIAAARLSTGLTEFRDEPMVRRQLDVFCAALRRPCMNFVGRLHLARNLVNCTSQNLRLSARLAAGTRVQLPRALFIVGMPRSGTTRLFHLLGLDRRAATTPYWELHSPLPPPGRDFERDERAVKMRAVIKQAPHSRLMQFHQFGADVPEEDQLLFLHSLVFHCAFACIGDAGMDAAWQSQRVDAALMAQVTLEHRVLLEAIFENRALPEDAHLVFKSTVHGEFLPQLVAQWPDAVFVQTHRPAPAALKSFAWLQMCIADLYVRHSDAPSLGARVAAEQLQHLTALKRYRQSLAPNDERRRFVDVDFADINRDPIGVIERIYTHFGMALTDDHRSAMQAHLRAHPSTSSATTFDGAMFKLDDTRIAEQFSGL